MKLFLFALFVMFAASRCGDANANTKTKSTTEKPTTMEVPNVQKAKALISSAAAGDAETVTQLLHPDYVQHNPFIPTGRDAFVGLLPVLTENKTHAENHRIFEDGDYVVMHNLWKNATPFGAPEMVSFDILRIDEQGLIAEHWDALMPNAEPNPSGRTLLDGPTEITDLEATDANKALVTQLVNDVLLGKNPEKITEYISSETYHQHNPAIRDGLDGVQEAFQYLIDNNDMFQYKTLHKVLGKGNFVLTISEGEWHGAGHVFYDLFRIDKDLVVEHWDVIQQIPTENLVNKNTMFGF